ncbi:unnamed protein product [Eruca vesicaria subsp. sativa]|uniref:Leucine-rich repeat-containing N-terminal plant-type domain-containing protein n=1 Tax=Eruca vesicaria subsp. sativa TaxID=29727 RepID=A0ABC8JVT6_ERUVS|nr:unnamed protein product [Eruca vesicaria subsp. sativa]
MSTIHTTLSFLLFFIFNYHDVFAIPTTYLCRPEQRNALLEFKNEFEIRNSSSLYCSNNRGSKVSFYSKTESWKNNTNCCYWDGITCDAKTGKVVELDLSCSRLHGRFHSNSFQNLGSLTILDLSSNGLYGQIFFSVRKLSNLTSLKLSNNQFSGQIPSSVGKLSHLTSLTISNNQFSGQIPYSVGNLSHLTSLTISNNQFSGQIPDSIGNLSRLVNLSLSGNNFAGEIPSTFGSLYQLASLRVNFNNFSGNFPITLLNLTKLSYLSLSNNKFTGTLPPNMTSLSNLEYFDVDNNAFVGTFPSLTNLSSNSFTGMERSIKHGLSSDLRTLDISSNKITVYWKYSDFLKYLS